MKNLIILGVIAMLSPVFLRAQVSDPELDYIKKSYSREKKAIVEEYMGFDVQQGAKFWPVYGAYEAKREKLAIERIKLIQEYIDHSDNVSAALADKVAAGALVNSVNLDRLNLEYYNNVKKALGAVKAAKLLQLEIYLQTQWRGFVQSNVPLISDLDKSHTN